MLRNYEPKVIYLQIMEKKLLRIIINPAMILSFVFGFWLIHLVGIEGGWLHLKITLVLVLAGFNGFLSRWRKNFELGKNIHSQKFYRIINEVPAVLMVLIVFLVILKPF
jgi:putative membrane protein